MSASEKRKAAIEELRMRNFAALEQSEREQLFAEVESELTRILEANGILLNGFTLRQIEAAARMATTDLRKK